MSVEAMTWVFKHSRYVGVKRLVHLAMADVANSDYGNQIWLSRQALAAKANCSVDTVDRAIDDMLRNGDLVLLSKGGGRGNPSTYRLVMKGPQDAAVSEKGPHPERERAANAPVIPLINSIEPKDQNSRTLHPFPPLADDFSDQMAGLRRSLTTHPSARKDA